MLETYAKHLKTIVCGADCATAGAERPLGLTLEFVLDPARPWTFALLKAGAPLAGVPIFVTSEAGRLSRDCRLTPKPPTLRAMHGSAASEADDLQDEVEDGETIIVTLGADLCALRLDKALADAVPTLSRARIQALIEGGAVDRDGAVLTGGSARTVPGDYRIILPPLVSATPLPEAIPLTVLFEDGDLIVIDKPPGMAAHPAPGCWTGTLVNALLAHCGASLSGIGGVARPGIVHRLDKDTSGVMVAAKTDRAHAGLSALFATHDIERTYIALTRGAPSPARGRIQTQIGRSSGDRKKMAVLRSGGREAITDYVVERAFGLPAKPTGAPMAGRVACTLHTGRTHQIRVHLASKGAPILGDAVYGSGAPTTSVRAAIAEAGLTRQALHAAVLGLVHPVTREALRFETAPPADMRALETLLAAL